MEILILVSQAGVLVALIAYSCHVLTLTREVIAMRDYVHRAQIAERTAARRTFQTYDEYVAEQLRKFAASDTWEEDLQRIVESMKTR